MCIMMDVHRCGWATVYCLLPSYPAVSINTFHHYLTVGPVLSPLTFPNKVLLLSEPGRARFPAGSSLALGCSRGGAFLFGWCRKYRPINHFEAGIIGRGCGEAALAFPLRDSCSLG